MSFLIVDTLLRLLSHIRACKACGHRQQVPKEKEDKPVLCEKCGSNTLPEDQDR